MARWRQDGLNHGRCECPPGYDAVTDGGGSSCRRRFRYSCRGVAYVDGSRSSYGLGDMNADWKLRRKLVAEVGTC